MIQSHTIKYENNEEILYLYLDFSNEFAKELGDKNKSIFSNIKKYLKTLKDDFKGTKVVIVASGIVLATLTLNTGLMRQNAVARNDNNLYITSVHFNEPSVVVKDDNVEETVETKKVETVKPEVKTSQTNTNKQTTTKTTSQKSTSNKTTSTNSNTTKSTTKQETKSTTKTTTKTTNQTTKQSTNQTTLKNPITIYRSNGDILKLEFEDYIIGVVAAEMPASFNTEALKAQAVLARTYALKTVKQGKKLTDTVATQVYKDNNQLKKLWGSEYSKYYNKIKDAVSSTKDLTVKYNGEYIEAVYHSISNGKTEDAKYVWGNSFPYLQVVDSAYDANVKDYSKTVTKSYTDVSSKLGITVTKNSNIEISRNDSGRVSNLTIDGTSFTGVTIRTKLNLRSTDFDIEQGEDSLKITTRGYGHGVGMSQYGANEYAKKGWTYKQIINHYYPGVNIS